MSLPNNTLILTKEPFVGFMPADLRIWLRDHNKDADLAVALAEVNYDLERIGLYNIVKPFMEKNGFRDGSGWWLSL